MAKRSIVITGAARDVGAACARRFAADGDHLVLADRDEDKGRAIAEELRRDGAEVAFVAADVSSRLQVHNIIAEALETFGRIDVLAHTSFEYFSANFLETNEDDFQKVVSANLHGSFLVNQAAAKQFVKQIKEADANGAPGAIVNVMSVEAVTAAADHAAFAASQGGVHQLTKAVALAMSPYGIRTNAVGIGSIKNSDLSEADDADLMILSELPSP